MGFPGGSDGKESACSVGDPGSIPGSGRSPGEGNGNPLQYSCLENPMDRGAWQATVHEAAKSCSRLNNFTHFNFTNLYSWCNFTLNKFHRTLFKSRTVWNFEKVKLVYYSDKKSFLEQTFIESYCHLVAKDFILYFIMYNTSHVCWWSHGKEPVLTWHSFGKHSCRQWQVLTRSHLQGSPQCKVILSSTLIGGKAEWLVIHSYKSLECSDGTQT